MHFFSITFFLFQIEKLSHLGGSKMGNFTFVINPSIYEIVNFLSKS